MSNLSELIQLYGLDNLPDSVRKERELKRWRDIMAQQRLVQNYLPNFLEEEAKARESEIPQMATQRHLAWCGIRYEEYAGFSKDPEFIRRCQERRAMCFKLMGGKRINGR